MIVCLSALTYYTLWGHAFVSRLLSGFTLGIRLEQRVVTGTHTPKAISKNLLEKVTLLAREAGLGVM